MTGSQAVRLRELARWPGMPPEAAAYVERRIRDGMTDDAALRLLQRLGGRIARMSPMGDAAAATVPA